MGRKPKKKLEEMTELERLQAENAVLKNERTPIEGRKRAKRKTEIVRGLVTEFTLEILLKIIKLAHSTYYYHLKQLDQTDKSQTIKAEIQAIFTEHKGNYGYRRMTLELRNLGIVINHKRVQRLMHDAGLFGKRPKEKYHSYKGEVGKAADNVINRDFSTTLPLQKWTTDVSQFNFSWGKCYLSPILDMNTNEIISYDLALSPNLEQIKRMLDKAFDKYSSVNGLIFTLIKDGNINMLIIEIV